MTLPEVRRHPPTPAQREGLARWVAEWTLLQALRAEVVPEPPGARRPLLALSTALDTATVEVGDIRLLHPHIEPDDMRYVAVTARTGEQAWHVIPFGLLSEPATPGEVRTGRTPPALRVLCAWNRFTMSETELQCCWLADRLTPDERERLLDPVTSRPVAEGTEPWSADCTGPPIRHPLDPRWDYLEMESEFRQRVDSRRRKGATYDITSATQLRKAAEDRMSYGKPDSETTPGDSSNS